MQRGKRELRDVPGKVGIIHSGAVSRSELCFTLMPMEPCGKAPTHWSTKDWLRVGKGKKKKTQTSLCCKQGRPKLGGAWLGDLKKPRGRNFPAKLVTHMGCVGH